MISMGILNMLDENAEYIDTSKMGKDDYLMIDKDGHTEIVRKEDLISLDASRGKK